MTKDSKTSWNFFIQIFWLNWKYKKRINPLVSQLYTAYSREKRHFQCKLMYFHYLPPFGMSTEYHAQQLCKVPFFLLWKLVLICWRAYTSSIILKMHYFEFYFMWKMNNQYQDLREKNGQIEISIYVRGVIAKILREKSTKYQKACVHPTASSKCAR